MPSRTFKPALARTSAPAAAYRFASLSTAVLSFSISFNSKGNWLRGIKGSGIAITLNVLPFGQGRFATERIAASENSEPSVAIRTLNPGWCTLLALFSKGRTTSREHGACRRTERAVLPNRTRINAPSPLEPTNTKSAFHDFATLEITWRARPKTTSTSIFQPP